MSYHGTLNRLADDAAAKVLGIYNAWLGGDLTDGQFVQLAAAHIGVANARAVTLGDMALAAALTVQLGSVQPVTGVQPADDHGRLVAALGTLVAAHVAGEVIQARVSRLAASEVLSAVQDGFHNAMLEYEMVEGWSRQADAGACELCTSWASGDNFFPKSVKMIHHAGCQCTAKPIVRKDI